MGEHTRHCHAHATGANLCFSSTSAFDAALRHDEWGRPHFDVAKLDKHGVSILTGRPGICDLRYPGRPVAAMIYTLTANLTRSYGSSLPPDTA